MSDFILDLRRRPRPASSVPVADLMRFFPDMQVQTSTFEHFSFTQSRAGSESLWAPYTSEDQSIFVAITGRIALEAETWDAAGRVAGQGGRACKAVYAAYRARGAAALEELNGSFVVMVYDAARRQIELITDRSGMQPCYVVKTTAGTIIGSHPDIVAAAAGIENDLDEASMAEFLVSGKVHHPNTFYRAMQAVDCGTRFTYFLHKSGIVDESRHTYFSMQFKIDPAVRDDELSERLGQAFSNAVRRRTLPIFGRSAVSLSGGLDSRMVLCSAPDPKDLWAFSFYDAENYELGRAQAIARAAGVRFIPLQRSPDFYADQAEMSVRISGGTGNLFSNHYLGFRTQLRELGIDNIITAFFCDVLFKGYYMDTRVNKLLRTRSFAPFQLEYDQSYYWFGTQPANRVRERLEARYPAAMRTDDSPGGKLAIEASRIFPLSADLDNPSLLIPQRTMGWDLPSIDNDVLDMYLQIPAASKLRPNLYNRMVDRQCGPAVARISNTNTGARVNASYFEMLAGTQLRALVRKLRPANRSSDGSWPNWPYYLAHSPKVMQLWTHRDKAVIDRLDRIMGPRYRSFTPETYARTGSAKLLFRVLTLGVWLGQRVTGVQP